VSISEAALTRFTASVDGWTTDMRLMVQHLAAARRVQVWGRVLTAVVVVAVLLAGWALHRANLSDARYRLLQSEVTSLQGSNTALRSDVGSLKTENALLRTCLHNDIGVYLGGLAPDPRC
jgi:hypothetical protein